MKFLDEAEKYYESKLTNTERINQDEKNKNDANTHSHITIKKMKRKINKQQAKK